MKQQMLPANIWILQLTDEIRSRLRQVTSLEIYEGSTPNFHPQGLYSVEIFGRVGLNERDYRFGFMDMKVRILHPKIFKDLVKLKQLYGEILAGRATAVFDEATQDFVASSDPEAETGYAFFVKHFPNLKFKRNSSPSRTERIEEIEKYRGQAFTRYLAVMPAGIRDIEVNETGRSSKHEINDIYYKVLSIANTIAENTDLESPVLDISRYSLTLAFAEIYEIIMLMIGGKRGFLLSKWASRRVFHGNRNVLTSMNTAAPRLDSINAPGLDSVALGLYQLVKAIIPVTIHALRTRILSRVFGEYDTDVALINPETLKPEYVPISPEIRDRWTTVDGLTDVINTLSTPELRHTSVTIDDRYLALIYTDAESFKILYDIEELPSNLDASNVRPLTYMELVYLCNYDKWNDYYATVTRYPITGVESVVPAKVYVNTTSRADIKYERNDDWVVDKSRIALEFPRYGLQGFIDTLSPHPTRLSGMMADFDGDTGSFIAVMTREALEENRKFLSSREAWVDNDGRPRADMGYDTLNLVIRNMTGRFPK